jgi:tetratricopeptide (TPR) repeat protein
MMKFLSWFLHRISARVFFLSMGITFMQVVLFAQEPDQVKAELFRELDAKMQQARQEEVPTFAPALFAKAQGFYNRAEQNYKRGERIEKIRGELQQAMQVLNKAFETTKVSKVALAELVDTRKKATQLEYIELAPKEFAQAERDYQEAILKAEAGDVRSAREKAVRAIKSYREAFLALEKSPSKDGETRRCWPDCQDCIGQYKNSLSAAVAAIGPGQKTLIIDKTIEIPANLTVPSNIHLWFLKCGSLSIADGATVTINGPITAGMFRIFQFDFTYFRDNPTWKPVYGAMQVDRIYPEWFGAKGNANYRDDATGNWFEDPLLTIAANDDYCAIQAAMNVFTNVVPLDVNNTEHFNRNSGEVFLTKRYMIGSTLRIPELNLGRIALTGTNRGFGYDNYVTAGMWGSTIIKCNGGYALKILSDTRTVVSGIQFACNADKIDGNVVGGIYIDTHSGQVKIIDCSFIRGYAQICFANRADQMVPYNVFIERCQFQNYLKAEEYSGHWITSPDQDRQSALRFEGRAQLIANNCDFNSGASFVYAPEGTSFLVFDGCTFQSCVMQGFFSRKTTYLYVYNSIFEDCTTCRYRDGTFYSVGTDGRLAIFDINTTGAGPAGQLLLDRVNHIAGWTADSLDSEGNEGRTVILAAVTDVVTRQGLFQPGQRPFARIFGNYRIDMHGTTISTNLIGSSHPNSDKDALNTYIGNVEDYDRYSPDVDMINHGPSRSGYVGFCEWSQPPGMYTRQDQDHGSLSIGHLGAERWYWNDENNRHYQWAAIRNMSDFGPDSKMGDILWKPDAKDGDPLGFYCIESGSGWGKSGNGIWKPFGQVGYRTSAGAPNASTPYLMPNFVGEELLDTTNNIWYKAVGTTGADDWKPITN